MKNPHKMRYISNTPQFSQYAKMRINETNKVSQI